MNAKFLPLGLALSAMLTIGSTARAEFVSFITVGTFTGGDLPGSSTYLDAANGISIVFNSSVNNAVEVPPASQVSFGQFDTSGTTATTLQGVSSDFILDIIQLAPTGGNISFVGQLSGSLQILNSQAFVQFDQDNLSAEIGSILYRIVSADSNTPGRVNIAPPNTNNGLTTIAGEVVPEPSSVVMLSLGCAALLTVGYRNRRALRRAAA